MKILAPVFILLTLLAACQQNTNRRGYNMGYPMGMEMNEGNERGEVGERH